MAPARRLVPLLTASALAVALAGCTGAPGPAAPGDGLVHIVASTNVYGGIVEAIGGDRVEVTSLIGGAQDPHEYEASSRDELEIAEADLLVANGGGYDDFFFQLVDASGSDAPLIVASGTESADEQLPNEHVWYDLGRMDDLAASIADDLTVIDPDGASAYADGLRAFQAGILDLESRAHEIAADHGGEQVVMTELVPGYLLAEAGLVDATPAEFSEAIEEGSGVPVRVLADLEALVASGDVAFLAANTQSFGPETGALIDAARGAGVPVVSFAETLPEGETYLSWMSANLGAAAAALE
ncbi:MAG: zinc ABC transporter substrate-binding protein [Microbacteriaceae bacterium]|nr:zinc ABC transporter substrate-binding protein [Microbacteriaceae bacterium]